MYFFFFRDIPIINLDGFGYVSDNVTDDLLCVVYYTSPSNIPYSWTYFEQSLTFMASWLSYPPTYKNSFKLKCAECFTVIHWNYNWVHMRGNNLNERSQEVSLHFHTSNNRGVGAETNALQKMTYQVTCIYNLCQHTITITSQMTFAFVKAE